MQQPPYSRSFTQLLRLRIPSFSSAASQLTRKNSKRRSRRVKDEENVALRSTAGYLGKVEDCLQLRLGQDYSTG
jgi:hypothetical protein